MDSMFNEYNYSLILLLLFIVATYIMVIFDYLFLRSFVYELEDKYNKDLRHVYDTIYDNEKNNANELTIKLDELEQEIESKLNRFIKKITKKYEEFSQQTIKTNEDLFDFIENKVNNNEIYANQQFKKITLQIEDIRDSLIDLNERKNDIRMQISHMENNIFELDENMIEIKEELQKSQKDIHQNIDYEI